MKFNKLFDHTLLKQEATSQEIVKLCGEAKEYDFMSVCVNPCYVPLAKKELAGSDVKVCTVIGFPLGNNEPALKAAEARLAVEEGADEVDMVLNVGTLREGNDEAVAKDIEGVRLAIDAVKPGIILKVIIESALLTDDEIVRACKASLKGRADFVKTSTGFNKAGGASAHAVKIMRETVGDKAGVKASGGIHSKEDVDAMVGAGANRIGCSASVAIMKSL